MLITHDLGVVAQVCDRVMVMYAGRIIEEGTVGDIFHRAVHPYTRALLESIPKRGREYPNGRLPTISGIVPSLTELPVGCRFEARCRYSDGSRCLHDEPTLDAAGENRSVRCHYPLGTDRERPLNVSISAGSVSNAPAGEEAG